MKQDVRKAVLLPIHLRENGLVRIFMTGMAVFVIPVLRKEELLILRRVIIMQSCFRIAEQ